ncbi:Glycosyltransferase family 9 (heptosyltransferase) [Microlunatus sagamiharensis]|uniref:Glycosyltransferase family 9 (Heptosyltransferase) n=1 Tax=Microlunatus sagamiharensis TaxID=546874 RepID=A0A1H2MZB6_9ACTN|nr:Glycosyltransferase family 9 (heptosyltransferase) [Microlunatus sagamiharensis]
MRRILVVELLGGFGDVLLALPAIHALARSHPAAELTVLTFTPGDVLLAHDPLVARVVATSDHTDGVPRTVVEAELDAAERAGRAYDLVVTTTTYDGIGELCAARAPRAVTNLWRSPPVDELIDRRFVRLLVEDGLVDPRFVDEPPTVTLTETEWSAARDRLPNFSPSDHLSGGQRARSSPVVLVPGSGMRVKEWPAERWVALAARAAAGGHPVLTAGAAGSEPVPGTTLLPPGSLRELAANLAVVGEAGGVVVGGDTGPVRLATAVGARAVALFGPTVAGRYGLDPRSGSSLQGLPGCEVRRPLAISEQECWWSARCPLTGDAPACLADLPVDRVAAVVLASRVHPEASP